MTDEERVLWRIGDIECVLISCCAGAELQLRRTRDGRGDDARGTIATGEILLRELYPTKSDLYERSRMLEAEYGNGKEALIPDP